MGAEWLLERVRVITDPVLRRRTLALTLGGADPALVVPAAHELITRAAGTGADTELRALLATFVHALGDVAYDARVELYREARTRGADALARLLFDASPPTVDDTVLARQLKPERPLRAQGRPLTLGERKALARSGRRDLLMHLVRDPHPDVVRILLDNPHLIERDVVAVAAARPAVPASLALVADHPRWSVRHIVRRALVFNPHTPVHLAVRLATTLSGMDWREIASDPHLPDALRQHARELGRERAR